LPLTTFHTRGSKCDTYKDLSPDRCLASVNTLSELTVVFILEIREGKFLYIETAEAICRGKIRDFRHKQISSNHIDTYTAKNH